MLNSISYNPSNRTNSPPVVINRDFQEFLTRINNNDEINWNRVTKNSIPPKEEAKPKSSIPVIIGTIIGTAIPLFFLHKAQVKNIKLEILSKTKDNIVSTLKKHTPFDKKTCEKIADFHQKYNILNVKYDTYPPMLWVGLGSIAGGLLGGIVSDVKNVNKKIQESVFQYINLAVPTVCVAKLLKYAENKDFINKMPFVKALGQNTTSNILKLASIVIGVAGGMQIGVRISNYVNDQLFPGEFKDKREIHPKDYLVHTDDLVGALALLKMPILEKLPIDKILPFLYGMCGYHGGMKE